jgi:HD superfamily phosphohydrolase/uncharacterized protein YjbK
MHIKDVIYGDIEMPARFQAVIDTPEFQRLRRIKQLATANLVFPAANHTRFEHSIGTYHVMKKIVDHFTAFFERLDKDIVFKQLDIDAVLMAALLHDIGHGPFSHAFEQALGNAFDHEEMTCKIITSGATEVNKKLKLHFGGDFPQKVVNYIDLRNEHKGNVKTGKGNGLNNKNSSEGIEYRHLYENFAWIFHQLVSSQLDADRMDYILRDAHEAGVPFGNFSVNDLISGMQITFFENRYYVCVLEDYLNHVEGYLYARYQMYRNVYMDSYKIFTEELLTKIIQRSKDLYSRGGGFALSMHGAIKIFFDNKIMEIDNFLKLDDHVVISAIMDWIESEDKALSMLCKSFLERSGFRKVVLLSNKSEEVRLFKKEFLHICRRYSVLPDSFSKKSPDAVENWALFDDFYFWVENSRRFLIYDKDSSKIYVQCADGLVREFTDVSSFIAPGKETASAYYIHFGLLELFYEEHKKGERGDSPGVFIQEAQKLLDSFNSRKHLEIESKYIVKEDDCGIFEDIMEFAKARNDYDISEPSCFFQWDEYYDYDDLKLYAMGKSIRVRSIVDTYMVTYKEAIEDSNTEQNGNQTIRIEKEAGIESPDIKSCWPLIANSIPDIDALDPLKLENILTIKNNRKKFTLKKDGFLLEIVFDDVVYRSREGKEHNEKQIEIELKSPYEYRINLKLFTELLDSHFGERIKQNHQSKLERGLLLLPPHHAAPDPVSS